MTRASIRPTLIVITDVTVASPDVLVSRLEGLMAACTPGAVLVQLRDRQMPVRQRLELGRTLSLLCRQHAQYFAVNDRCDLAALTDAAGVHLAEFSVPARDARALLGDRAFLSAAWHDESRLPEPEVDAAVLSPIVSARKGRAALGIGALSAAKRRLEARASVRPLLYALGGVDASTAAACLQSGADGVAVIGAALDGRDVLPLLAALAIDR